jgi:type IV secretory pathway VirB4 component
MSELFEITDFEMETETKPPITKPKRKYKNELSEAEKERRREQLKQGRLTALKNRQAKVQELKTQKETIKKKKETLVHDNLNELEQLKNQIKELTTMVHEAKQHKPKVEEVKQPIKKETSKNIIFEGSNIQHKYVYIEPPPDIPKPQPPKKVIEVLTTGRRKRF